MKNYIVLLLIGSIFSLISFLIFSTPSKENIEVHSEKLLFSLDHSLTEKTLLKNSKSTLIDSTNTIDDLVAYIDSLSSYIVAIFKHNNQNKYEVIQLSNQKKLGDIWDDEKSEFLKISKHFANNSSAIFNPYDTSIQVKFINDIHSSSNGNIKIYGRNIEFNSYEEGKKRKKSQTSYHFFIPHEWISDSTLLLELVNDERTSSNSWYLLNTYNGSFSTQLPIPPNFNRSYLDPSNKYFIHSTTNGSLTQSFKIYDFETKQTQLLTNVLDGEWSFKGFSTINLINNTPDSTYQNMLSSYFPLMPVYDPAQHGCELPNAPNFELPYPCGQAMCVERDGPDNCGSCNKSGPQYNGCSLNIGPGVTSACNICPLMTCGHDYRPAIDFGDGQLIDDSGALTGKDVLASADGFAVYREEFPGAGYYVQILHNMPGNDWCTSNYFHLVNNSWPSNFQKLSTTSNFYTDFMNIAVPVNKGDKIGIGGNTGGTATDPYPVHHHFELKNSQHKSYYPKFNERGGGTFTPRTGHTYVSHNSNISTYSPCNNIIQATCGQVINVNTANGDALWETYGCSTNTGSSTVTWENRPKELIYGITTQNQGDLIVTLNNIQTGIDPNIYILTNSSGCTDLDPIRDCVGTTHFATSSNSNGATYLNAPSGTYYIIVELEGGVGSTITSTFDMTITATGGCQSLFCDINEPQNNSATSSSPLLNVGSNTIISNQIINSCLDFDQTDFDYYTFTPTSKGKLTVDISGELSNLFLATTLYDLQIVDDNGNTIANDGLFSPHHVELCVGPTTNYPLGKTYYLKLKSNNPLNLINGTKDYTITYSWTTSQTGCYSGFQWINVAYASELVDICDGEAVTLDIDNPNGFINVLDNQGNLLSTTIPYTVYPTQNTNYYVYDYKPNGNVEEEVYNVFINSVNTPSISPNPTGINPPGTSITLSAVAQGASSYQWNTGGQTPSITVSPLQTTTYTVTATNSNGCPATQTHTVNVTGTTAQTPTNNTASTATTILVGTQCNTSSATSGTLIGATMSNNTAIIAPTGCAPTSTSGNNNGNFNSGTGGDVWYKFTAPSSGQVTIETYGSGLINDLVIAIYQKVGNSYIYAGCYDDYILGVDFMPRATLTGLTSGGEYYIRVWEFSNNQAGPFSICVFDSGNAGGGGTGTNGSDIQITSVSASESNGTITVNWSIKNNGNQSTSVGYPSGWNLVTDLRFGSGTPQSANFGTQQTVHGTSSHIAPNATVSYSQSFPVPANTANGQYAIVVWYDPLGITGDLNLSDNYGYTSIYIGGTGGGVLYDWDLTNGLDITLDNSYTQWAPGAVFEVELEIENEGTDKSPPIDVEIIFSENPTPSTGDETYTLGWLHFDEINDNDDDTESEDYTVPFVTSTGTWYVSDVLKIN